MTNPTAKGYTTAPSLEEMKAAVLAVYPLTVVDTVQGYSALWLHGMRPKTSIRFSAKDGVSGTDRAWADAYSKLPAKPAPEPPKCLATLDDTLGCSAPAVDVDRALYDALKQMASAHADDWYDDVNYVVNARKALALYESKGKL